MAIDIQLTNKFKMKSNAHCIQLCKMNIAGSEASVPGEVRYISIADCTSFDSFFRAYVHHSLLEASDENGHDITNFADLMDEMNDVLNQIKQIVDFSDILQNKTIKECNQHIQEKLKNNNPELFKKTTHRRKKRPKKEV